jgi:hypothetical protein
VKLTPKENVFTVEYNTCRFLDLILDTIQNCQHVLNPLYPDNIPKGDFTFTIWMPLLRRLFNINSNIIGLKPNESVSDDSTNEKVYIYSDSHTNLIGFKVDLRFLYDFEGKEFGICNVVCSKSHAGDEKIYGDHTKLIREGKTNTISLCNITEDLDPVYTWIIQVCGLKLFVCLTVVHVGNDLLLLVLQFNVTYPLVISLSWQQNAKETTIRPMQGNIYRKRQLVERS